MRTAIPGLTPHQVRRRRFPCTNGSEPSPEREARLAEILHLVKTGYSRRETIQGELREELRERVLKRDLQELKTRGKVKIAARVYWVPA